MLKIMIILLASNDERITLKLHSHGRLLAVKIGILPFNSSTIAFVSFFVDLRKKKGKMPTLAAKSRWCECSFRYFLLKAGAKVEPAGPRPFLEIL